MFAWRRPCGEAWDAVSEQQWFIKLLRTNAMCVCVCVCARVRACLPACKRARVCACVRANAYACVYASLRSNACLPVSLLSFSCTRINAHPFLRGSPSLSTSCPSLAKRASGPLAARILALFCLLTRKLFVLTWFSSSVGSQHLKYLY